MPTVFSASQLQQTLRDPGLLGFPLTDFDGDGAFAPDPFEARVEWLQSFGPAALFIAGGAGEYFSLSPDEEALVLKSALAVRTGRIPLIAAAGKGTWEAIAAARAAECMGADGVLLLPPYLTETSQDGLAAHIAAVCAATDLGVIVYGRANARPRADTLARLCESCPNLIGYKDGVGDVEELWAIRTRLAERLVLFNGMPTAELYAPSFRSMGVPSYSSAVFNFLPAYALEFFRASTEGDLASIERMMTAFYIPYGRLRARQPGYAVSIVKAGAAIVGRDAGPVRPPLSGLTADERRDLAALIAAVETTPHVNRTATG